MSVLKTDFSKIMKDIEKKKGVKGTRELEDPMVKRTIDWLNRLPCCGARKRVGGPYNKSEPDVTGCIYGRRIEIEGKIGDNQPTDQQLKRLKYWKDLGAITGTFWCEEDAVDILCKHMNWDKKKLLKEYPL